MKTNLLRCTVFILFIRILGTLFYPWTSRKHNLGIGNSLKSEGIIKLSIWKGSHKSFQSFKLAFFPMSKSIHSVIKTVRIVIFLVEIHRTYLDL